MTNINTDQDDWNQLFKEARKKLKDIAGEKRKIILSLAADLVKHNMEESKVCAAITKEFGEDKDVQISHTWISENLPNKYKQINKAHKTMNGKPLQTNAEKMLAVVGNDGKTHTEKPPSKQDAYKEISKQLAEKEIKILNYEAEQREKNPLIDIMRQNGFNPYDKHPHNFYAKSAKELEELLAKFIKDNKEAKGFYVLIQVTNENVRDTTNKVQTSI